MPPPSDEEPDDIGMEDRGRWDERRRRRTRWRLSRPAKPARTPEARNALTRLTRLFAAAAPARRQELVVGVRTLLPATDRAEVILTLLQALLRSQAGARRAGLAAALADLGPVAGGLAGWTLFQVEEDWQRAVLAEVFARAGQDIPAGDRAAFLVGMSLLPGRMTNPDAAEAVAEAAAAIRWSIERAACPPTPGGGQTGGPRPAPPGG